jgi:enoyl-CoA hydratase
MRGYGDYQRLDLGNNGSILRIELASNKVNAIDLELCREIEAVLDRSARDPGVGALVLTGKGKVFSAGVAVDQVLANEKEHSDLLLRALGSALVKLFAFPKPTVAAINGRAVAGGCLLACACDQRLIAEGARIGVTELEVGVAFPTPAIELVMYVGGAHAERLVMGADLVGHEDALALGLAHRAVPPDQLSLAAQATAERLASLDQRAYELAKRSLRRHTLQRIADEQGATIDRQVEEQWRADETRANLERLLGPKR